MTFAGVMWILIKILAFTLLVVNSLWCWRQIYKLAGNVFFFEDVHSQILEEFDDTIEALFVVEEQLDAVIAMPIFFENEELRAIIDAAKNETKISRLVVRHSAEKFVARIKNSKVLHVEVEEPVPSIGL